MCLSKAVDLNHTLLSGSEWSRSQKNSCMSEVLSYSLLFHSGKVSNKVVSQDYEEKINIHQSHWEKKVDKIIL